MGGERRERENVRGWEREGARGKGGEREREESELRACKGQAHFVECVIA